MNSLHYSQEKKCRKKIHHNGFFFRQWVMGNFTCSFLIFLARFLKNKTKWSRYLLFLKSIKKGFFFFFFRVIRNQLFPLPKETSISFLYRPQSDCQELCPSPADSSICNTGYRFLRSAKFAQFVIVFFFLT